MPQLQECSGAWLEARGEEAEGTVVARFEIGPDDGGVGRVTAVELGASEVKHAAVEGCVLNVARSLEFEMSDGAGAVRVTYPIQFSRAEAAPDANRAAGAEPAP